MEENIHSQDDLNDGEWKAHEENELKIQTELSFP